MTRLLLVFVALIPLAFASPALAQSSRPAKTPPAKKPAKKPAKEPAGKKKPSLTKDGARKLVHSFLIAVEKKDYAKAVTMVEFPFFVVSDGKLLKWDKAQLETALKGKFGAKAAKQVKAFRKSSEKEMTALYWGPKSKRAKATAKRHKEITNVGWVGVVYAGKQKKAEDAKKPFAVKLLKGKLRIVAFHDD